MSFRRIVALPVASLAVVATLSACESKQDFEACAMTTKMKADCKAAILEGSEQCRESEVYCFDSCIVRDHPQCLDGPCVMYEGRTIQERVVFDVDPVCTMSCHGVACPSGSACRQISSLKVSCSTDEDCAKSGPWSVCEENRACEGSGLACETAADCNAGQACNVASGGTRYCTWKFCVPAPSAIAAE